MVSPTCRLEQEGFICGSCGMVVDGTMQPACRLTLKRVGEHWYRRIQSIHLSRPENYLSIYQSGCNFACRKCHSWAFSQQPQGTWFSAEDILTRAIEYEKRVSVWEPRERATAWHAYDTCRCCGSCLTYGRRSDGCPAILAFDAILLSAQGIGPARNIVAFTGGDLCCQPEFYGSCAQLIKAHTKLWVLLETNGYGLIPKHLDYLRECGVDSFWLDIKAYDNQKHAWLTGCPNQRILNLPAQIKARGFVLEVLSLYIPGLVETNELVKIAGLLQRIDPTIPFTILAFFPEYQMRQFASPRVTDMVEAYNAVKDVGLEQVRLGNMGVFIHTEEDWQYLMAHVDQDGY